MTQTAQQDIKAIACNVTVASSTFSAGALCYVIDSCVLGRIHVTGRSRGGRWVRCWMNPKHLGNFRLKTVPPESRVYNRIPQIDKTQDSVDYLSEMSSK